MGSVTMPPSVYATSTSTVRLPPIIRQEKVLAASLARAKRALKREKRKHANSESAKRSRVCKRLKARVKALRKEAKLLQEELLRPSEECHKVASENAALQDEVVNMYGPGRDGAK